MTKIVFIFLLLSFSFFFLVTPVNAQFDPLNEACDSTSAGGSEVCREAAAQDDTNPITGPGGVTNTIARILSLVVGLAAVAMIIIGGIAYASSGGNSEQQTKARRRVIYGFVGLAVAVLGWTIITYITDKLL